jgi:hypothetical protein
MNCIEKLRLLSKECEPCVVKAKIIEFEQLPEYLKFDADYYDKDKDFILFCEPCQVYKLIEGD